MSGAYGDSTRSVKAVGCGSIFRVDPSHRRRFPRPRTTSRPTKTTPWTATVADPIRRGGNWNRRSPQLEGAAAALTFGSGMAAITSVLRTLAEPGRTLVVPADGYYQVRAYANEFLAPRGVTVVEARCDRDV